MNYCHLPFNSIYCFIYSVYFCVRVCARAKSTAYCTIEIYVQFCFKLSLFAETRLLASLISFRIRNTFSSLARNSFVSFCSNLWNVRYAVWISLTLIEENQHHIFKYIIQIVVWFFSHLGFKEQMLFNLNNFSLNIKYSDGFW